MFFQGSQPSTEKNSLIIRRLPKFRQVNCPGFVPKRRILNIFGTFIQTDMQVITCRFRFIFTPPCQVQRAAFCATSGQKEIK